MLDLLVLSNFFFVTLNVESVVTNLNCSNALFWSVCFLWYKYVLEKNNEKTGTVRKWKYFGETVYSIYAYLNEVKDERPSLN